MALESYDRWYILSHSQGTVLAFEGLMESEQVLPNYLDEELWEEVKEKGLAYEAAEQARDKWATGFMRPRRPHWLTPKDLISRQKLFKNLSGFMTYGSPLNLFAEIWPQLVSINTKDEDEDAFSDEFSWINVYDPSDPVAGETTGKSFNPSLERGFFEPSNNQKLTPKEIAYKAPLFHLLSHIKYFDFYRGKSDELVNVTALWLLRGGNFREDCLRKVQYKNRWELSQIIIWFVLLFLATFIATIIMLVAKTIILLIFQTVWPPLSTTFLKEIKETFKILGLLFKPLELLFNESTKILSSLPYLKELTGKIGTISELLSTIFVDLFSQPTKILSSLPYLKELTGKIGTISELIFTIFVDLFSQLIEILISLPKSVTLFLWGIVFVLIWSYIKNYIIDEIELRGNVELAISEIKDFFQQNPDKTFTLKALQDRFEDFYRPDTSEKAIRELEEKRVIITNSPPGGEKEFIYPSLKIRFSENPRSKKSFEQLPSQEKSEILRLFDRRIRVNSTPTEDDNYFYEEFDDDGEQYWRLAISTYSKVDDDYYIVVVIYKLGREIPSTADIVLVDRISSLV